MRPTAFVLGITCNGLSVVRSLGRKGIRVVAVDAYTDRPGLKSRYADEVVFAPTNIIDDEAPWLSFLIGLAEDESVKPVLFPTEDAYVLFIAKHREVLAQHFEFNLAPDQVVYASVSKLGTYDLALECDIPTPWTYVVRTMDDYERIREKVSFPCALKPSLAHVWLEKYSTEKLLVIRRPEELESRLGRLMELGIEVVLQEIIPGGDSQVYVFEVCVGRDGEVLGYACMHKLRQWPVDFGVGAFDVSVVEPRLAEVALQLLRRSGYRGIASSEYMLDPRDGLFKLIDINPRTCMIGELAIASGVDIPYLYYRDVSGETVKPVSMSKPGVKFQCFDWDLRSFLVYRRRGALTFGKWLRSLQGPTVYAYFARDDIGPFFSAAYRFIKRVVFVFYNKLKHSLSGRAAVDQAPEKSF
jgi:predicted ATP-grasp superfamily ATP-dependent carboligase